MRRLTDDLILYSFEEDSLPVQAEKLFSEDADNMTSAAARRIAAELIRLAGEYGFRGNLWHSYMAFYIASSENVFSLEEERRKKSEEPTAAGILAAHDFKILRRIFLWDFGQGCDGDCFKLLSDYRPRNVKLSDGGAASEELKAELERASDDEEFFEAAAAFYRRRGAGKAGLSRAFTLNTDEGGAELCPIKKTEDISLEDLIGYEVQKQRLTANTEAFLRGRPANNVLLFGDGGTGKSTSIRAIANRYYEDGLRIIQVYRHQMRYLSKLIDKIKNRNYRFIIYMDDLSFEDFETEYKYLKAVIEGGLEKRPENVLIYATSNRRHLIKETWKDRSDMETAGDIHRSDSTEEKLSLAERFGMQIYYGKPTKEEFHRIVETLAAREGVVTDRETLHAEAVKWEIRHGGVSGRSARQFIDYIKGTEENTK